MAYVFIPDRCRKAQAIYEGYAIVLRNEGQGYFAVTERCRSLLRKLLNRHHSFTLDGRNIEDEFCFPGASAEGETSITSRQPEERAFRARFEGLHTIGVDAPLRQIG
ncbi:hypothetical protein D9M73_101680 [compost metagenome]